MRVTREETIAREWMGLGLEVTEAVEIAGPAATEEPECSVCREKHSTDGRHPCE